MKWSKILLVSFCWEIMGLGVSFAQSHWGIQKSQCNNTECTYRVFIQEPFSNEEGQALKRAFEQKEGIIKCTFSLENHYYDVTVITNFHPRYLRDVVKLAGLNIKKSPGRVD